MWKRRRFLQGSALAMAAVAFGAESATLRLLCWSEYVPPALLESFTRESGVRVAVETFASNEEMLAKLAARPGHYDLVQPSGFYVEMLAARGELEPLRRERLSGWQHLDPAYLGFAFDPENRWSVPWLAGTVGIVTNTARVSEPVRSWAAVFDGAHARRIVVVDDPREMVTWALATLGRPLEDVSDDALQTTEPLLRRWLPQVAVFDSDSPKTALLEGKADVGILWSGEAALLWQQDRRFQYYVPEAGGHQFVDSLAIPRGAPRRSEAEQFIDYCLQPEVSVLISRAFPYTNPNTAARRLLTPEELANPASYPPGAASLPMLRNRGNTTAAVGKFVTALRASLPVPR